MLSPTSKFSTLVIYTFKLWNFHLISFYSFYFSDENSPCEFTVCISSFKSLSKLVTAALTLSDKCDFWVLSWSISIDLSPPWGSITFSYFFTCNFFFFNWIYLSDSWVFCLPQTPSSDMFRFCSCLKTGECPHEKSINKCHLLPFKIRFIQFMLASGYSPIL